MTLVSWRAALAVTAVVASVVAATAVAGEDGAGRAVAAVFGLAAAAVVGATTMAAAWRRNVPWSVGRTPVWVLVACGVGVAGIAESLTGAVGSNVRVAAAALSAGGCALALRGRARGREVDGLAVSAIVTLAAAYVLWTAWLGHRSAELHELVAAAAMAMAATLALRVVRLADDRPVAFALLTLGLALQAAAASLRIGSRFDESAPVVALVGFGVVVAAALHASMDTVFARVERRAVPFGAVEATVLATAPLAAPIVLATRAEAGDPVDITAAAIVSCIVSALVVAHLLRALRHRADAERQARHDELTGLPRRELFEERLVLALASAYQRGSALAVLFLDLDRFKKVNDSLGHAVGDQLLQFVARRLRRCMREGDVVARRGGDEFTVLLPDIELVDDAVAVAQKVLRSFEEPFTIGKRQLFVSPSIGIAVYPADGTDVSALLKNADAAMYRAKEKGRNTLELYTPDLNLQAVARLDLENDLHQALTKGQLVLHYQPKVALRTGAVVGVEALVRWRHPTLGLLAPESFIELAEESGIIDDVGEWVLRTACAQGRAWQDSGLPRVTVAVNLSARQFRQRRMDELVATVLDETGFDPRLLELELTESVALIGDEDTDAVLREIRRLGVSCSVDDFGIGYSGLSYLSRLPIDRIKLDKSFVTQIGPAGSGATIVVGIIALAHKLGLEVVAEGVETREQLLVLRANGCDQMQGYLFSKPLPAEEIESLFVLELGAPGFGSSVLSPDTGEGPSAGRRPGAPVGVTVSLDDL